MFATGDGAGFATDLGRFLPIARRSPTNYVLVMVCRIAWDHRAFLGRVLRDTPSYADAPSLVRPGCPGRVPFTAR